MSSLLSAAENVAGQCQNVRRDLQKMEEESGVVELALENHNLFIFGFVLEKRFNYICILCLYFRYYCDAVDAR